MTDNPFFRSTTPADPSSSNPVDPLAGGNQAQPSTTDTSAPADLPGSQPVVPPVVSDNANAPLNDLSQAISAVEPVAIPAETNTIEAGTSSVPQVNTLESTLPATENLTVPNTTEAVNNLTEPITPAQPAIIESSPSVPTIPEILAVPAASEPEAPGPATTQVPITPELNSVSQSESVSAAPVLNPPVDTVPDLDAPPETDALDTPVVDNMLSRASDSSVAPDAATTTVSEQMNPAQAITPSPLPEITTSEVQMNTEQPVTPLASSISDLPSMVNPAPLENMAAIPAESTMAQPADTNVSPVLNNTATVEQPLPSPLETPATVTPQEQMPVAAVAPLAETLAPAVPETVPPVEDPLKKNEVTPADATTTSSVTADGKMKNLLLLLGLLIVGIIALVLGIIVASSQ